MEGHWVDKWMGGWKDRSSDRINGWMFRWMDGLDILVGLIIKSQT